MHTIVVHGYWVGTLKSSPLPSWCLEHARLYAIDSRNGAKRGLWRAGVEAGGPDQQCSTVQAERRLPPAGAGINVIFPTVPSTLPL